MKISRIVTVSVLLLTLCSLIAAPAFAKHSGASAGNTGAWGGAPPENPGAWATGQHPHKSGVESSGGIVELVKTALIVVGLL